MDEETHSDNDQKKKDLKIKDLVRVLVIKFDQKFKSAKLLDIELRKLYSVLPKHFKFTSSGNLILFYDTTIDVKTIINDKETFGGIKKIQLKDKETNIDLVIKNMN